MGQWLGKVGGGGGITKLSELQIDVDKDWGGRKIRNIGAPLGGSDAARYDEVETIRRIVLDNIIEIMEIQARDNAQTIDYTGVKADVFTDANGYRDTVDTTATTALHNQVDKKYENPDIIDYTNFTEVDIAADHVSIDSPSRISFTNLDHNENVYIYRQTSVNVTGDFTAKGSFKITSASGGTNRNMFVFGYGSGIGRLEDSTEYVGLEIQNNGGNLLFIKSNDGGTSSSLNWNFNTQYWWTLTRSGNTITLTLYSDSQRTNQVGSTSITQTSIDTYNYCYAISARIGNTGKSISGYIYELEEATGVPRNTGAKDIVTSTVVTEASNIDSVQVEVKSPSKSTITYDASSDNGNTWTTNLSTGGKNSLTSTLGTQLKLKFHIDINEDLSAYSVIWWTQ
jgi:hypothetical protein